MIEADQAFHVRSDEGRATWFAGALMVQKAAGDDTQGRFDLLDQTMPPGYAVPRHVHHAEDEAWYVLDGEMTFQCGDREVIAGPHSWIFAPRDIPHTFVVGGAGARALTFAFPSGFANFVAEFGEPAAALIVPPPAPLDEARLVKLATKYGVDSRAPRHLVQRHAM